MKRDIVKELEERSFINPVGSVDVNKDMNLAHNLRGTLRDDNPYLSSLLMTHNKDQSDWLLKQGTDYDASVQAMYEKASLDFALSDPAVEIARQRAAGINPDYTGGSSGGASSGSAVSGQNIQVASNASTTPSESEHLQWQSAAQMLSSLSSLGNTIVSAVDTFSSLPSRIQLNKSQSNLADKQANLIDQQTPHLVSSAMHSSNSAFTESAMQNLAMYAKLANMFTSETPDSDISALLQTLGYTPDVIPGHLQNFRNYQSNPQIQKFYSDNRLEARKAAERNRVYSVSMYGQEVQNQQKITSRAQNLELLKSNFQNSLYSVLNTEGVGQSLAHNIASEVDNQAMQLDLQYQHLVRDLSAFTASIDAIALEFNSAQNLIDEINTRCELEERDPTPEEQAIIDSESIKLVRLNMLGSSQLQEVSSMMLHTANNAFWKSEYLGEKGKVVNFYTMDATKRFESMVFGDFVKEQQKGKSLATPFVQSAISLLSKNPKLGLLAGVVSSFFE